jgi:hypothetical protein
VPLPNTQPIHSAETPVGTFQESLHRLISAPQLGRTGRAYVEFHSNFNQAMENPDDPVTIISILRSSNLEELPEQWFDHVSWKKTRRAFKEIIEWKKGAKNWLEASRLGPMPWFPCSREVQCLRYLDPTIPGFEYADTKVGYGGRACISASRSPTATFLGGCTSRRSHLEKRQHEGAIEVTCCPPLG